MSTIHTNNLDTAIVGAPSRRTTSRVEGFSLIELLTVIAVIAILTAIIFPVFSSVREKARQGTVIDNLHRIQNAMEKYKLDHRGQYPQVLFAYSDGITSMSGIKDMGPVYLKGLYPQYINDPMVFTDPNSTAKDPSINTSVDVSVNALDTSGNLRKTTAKFYTADAYDVSPQVTSPGNVGTTMVPRYQLAWTSVPVPTSPEYQRQLILPAASDDTYITMTTYHVQNADKVIVLFKTGAAKVFDTSKLRSPGCGDIADISAPTGPNQSSPAKFWQIKPNGNCP